MEKGCKAIYIRTGLDAHKDNYKSLRKQTTNLAFEKKRKYYSERLGNSSNSSESLYSVINKLLDKKQENILPDTKNDLELADSFINYFTNKIDKIRSWFVMFLAISYHQSKELLLMSFIKLCYHMVSSAHLKTLYHQIFSKIILICFCLSRWNLLTCHLPKEVWNA